MLVNRTVLCKCIIEAENNFLLESIVACDPASNSMDLQMYFAANTAFLDDFEGLIDMLKEPVFQNIIMKKHILPISLE